MTTLHHPQRERVRFWPRMTPSWRMWLLLFPFAALGAGETVRHYREQWGWPAWSDLITGPILFGAVLLLAVILDRLLRRDKDPH